MQINYETEPAIPEWECLLCDYVREMGDFSDNDVRQLLVLAKSIDNYRQFFDYQKYLFYHVVGCLDADPSGGEV